MKEDMLKPVYIMWQEGVEDRYIDAVEDGVLAVFRTVGISAVPDLLVRRKGAWREDAMTMPDGSIVVGAGVSAWVAAARSASAVQGYLNASHLLDLLKRDPWPQNTHPHYSILVVREDIYRHRVDKDGKTHNDLVSGLARGGIGAVVTNSGAYKTESDRMQSVAFSVMHEMGHIFGLFLPLAPSGRTQAIETHEVYGTHCSNPCVMMRGTYEALDIAHHLRSQPFCRLCKIELSAYFFPPPISSEVVTP